MGDRCLVQFALTGGEWPFPVSPVAYSHWGGGAIPELLEALKAQMQYRHDDISYIFARCVGLMCERSGLHDDTGVGCWNSQHELGSDESQGDAGIIVVYLPEWTYRAEGGYAPEGFTTMKPHAPAKAKVKP